MVAILVQEASRREIYLVSFLNWHSFLPAKIRQRNLAVLRWDGMTELRRWIKQRIADLDEDIEFIRDTLLTGQMKKIHADEAIAAIERTKTTYQKLLAEAPPEQPGAFT